MTTAPPNPPMIPARWHGGAQTPKTIVIHGTVSPCALGGARAVAKFFATEDNKTSAHYVVDPGEVIQSVSDHVVAYHCGHNEDSIGIELCDPQAGSGARWGDKNHVAMLARAAELTARLCLAYDIPEIRVTPSALVAGKHGICGHVDMTNAFHQSTHTDPGPDFPWTDFIHQVKAASARIQGDPVPTAKTAPDLAAILADLTALTKKHKVSLLYLARVALSGAKSTGARAIAVRTARAVLKPFK